ncbi:ribose-phosphate pyrophosphokinase [uncultured Sphingomonas sp.]|uniref:ribose-phosphate pyrophosphokinase n=1 Tax=uncultured Sphingomonas sp. TaxID=158754 RepID=UPI0025DAA7CD|nr:ribose-phosphate pyrophosphokinase [uncultured Sphingomonas sp.]
MAETLSQWLEAEGIVASEGPGAIADVGRVRALLIEAAQAGEAISYSDLLGKLGHRFTRPKMRALCRTLDAVDQAAAFAGEPELAVLVVRETDRLPGQGWWTGSSEMRGYKGAWTGAEPSAFVRAIQQRAFTYWSAGDGRFG